MLQPAIIHKEALVKKFNSILYTDKYLWYAGSIDNYEWEIKEEADKFQYAVIHHGQIIGFISFRVDWYCSCVYNFGLIKFEDIYSTVDDDFVEYHSSMPIMISAIREVIKKIKDFDLHRIDFRCVSGNPAEKGYDGIIEKFDDKYDIRKVHFRDNIKDTHGKYHDTIMYEMIKR